MRFSTFSFFFRTLLFIFSRNLKNPLKESKLASPHWDQNLPIYRKDYKKIIYNKDFSYLMWLIFLMSYRPGQQTFSRDLSAFSNEKCPDPENFAFKSIKNCKNIRMCIVIQMF